MLNKRLHIIIAIMMIFIGVNSSTSAKDDVGISIKFMGGVTYKTESLLSGVSGYSGTGIPVGVSLLLEPDHSLSIGIESSLIKISSFSKKSINTTYGVTNTSVLYRTVPVLITAVLTKGNFEFITGFGTYYSFVTFESKDLDNSHYSDDWDMGFMLGLGYDISLFESFSLGATLKFYNIPERRVNLISPQLFLKYRLFNL